ncbi:hypothetical protein ACLKA7_001129 [Drosophila subpalustris]
MQHADCMKGKQANRAEGALLQDITHTPCQRLAAMSFTAQRKVSLAKYPVASSTYARLEAICCHHFRPPQQLYKLSCQQF